MSGFVNPTGFVYSLILLLLLLLVCPFVHLFLFLTVSLCLCLFVCLSSQKTVVSNVFALK